MASKAIGAAAPTIVNSSVVRTREYLTSSEVETLMTGARNSSRYGHRDATMILIAYRHGLRASEVCDLQWHQVELATGRLHVRRRKRGTPSVHPMQGDEIRALRREWQFDKARAALDRSRAYTDEVLALFYTLADFNQGLIERQEVPSFIKANVKNWLDEEDKALTAGRRGP